jgi:hypothetical protein
MLIISRSVLPRMKKFSDQSYRECKYYIQLIFQTKFIENIKILHSINFSGQTYREFKDMTFNKFLYQTYRE